MNTALAFVLAAAIAAAFAVPADAQAPAPAEAAVAWSADAAPVFLVQRPRRADGFAPGAGPGDVAASRGEGARLASANQLQDPAVDLAKRAAKAFATARGLGVRPDPLASPKAASGVRYIVEVSTSRWGLYGLSAGFGYRLLYGAQLRIIDAGGAVLAKDGCGPRDVKPADLRWPDVTLDHAAALKAALASAADQCLAKWTAGPLKP